MEVRRGICVNGSGLLFRSVSFSGLAQTLIFPEGEQRNKIAPLNMTRVECGRVGPLRKGQKLNEKCEKLILARDNLWPFGSGNDLPFIRFACAACVCLCRLYVCM